MNLQTGRKAPLLSAQLKFKNFVLCLLHAYECPPTVEQVHTK